MISREGAKTPSVGKCENSKHEFRNSKQTRAKHEIRNSKLETNSNDEKLKFQTNSNRNGVFEFSSFLDLIGCSFVSDFVLRISNFD